jgi:hypothetical protein
MDLSRGLGDVYKRQLLISGVTKGVTNKFQTQVG